MEYIIQNNHLEPVEPKKFPVVKLVLLVVSVIAIAAVTIIVIITLRNNGLVNDVQTALKTVPSAMKAAAKGGGYQSTIPTSVTTKDDVQLEGGGSYDGMTYCVTGTNKKNASIKYYIDSTMTTPQKGSCETTAHLPVPGVTPQLSISFTGSDQLGLTWQSASYAQSYIIQCATDMAFSQNIVIVTSKTLSARCTNLKPGMLYHVRVRAVNSTPGAWSSLLTTTTEKISIPPSNFKVSSISSSTVSYSFDAVSDATSYVIEYSPDINFTLDPVDVTVTKKEGTISGLLHNTAYYFQIKAVTADFDASHAGFSNWVTTTTRS